MTIRCLGLSWLALLVLCGIEIVLTFMLRGHIAAAFVLLSMAAMFTLVMQVFMRLRTAGGLSQAFGVSGLLWLAILLGLGSMDPLTRTGMPS